MQIIRLKFRKTNNSSFYVTLSCNDRPWEVEGYLSLMPVSLREALSNWQASYRQLDMLRSNRSNLRIVPKSVKVNSSSEWIDAVRTELNVWLNNSEAQWQPIRDALIAFVDRLEEELQITLNSRNIDLCRLPWQEWDLLQQYYPHSEVAISTPTAKDIGIVMRPNIAIANPQLGISRRRRILLVVGKSEGINTQSDLQTIDRLLGKQAEIVCLLQPSLKDFASALWCERGYDIFIFTGHSGSNEDGTIGWIEINDYQRLTIEEFKDSFKQAIGNGLQLAIFNSCDGLGLADRLSELNLAQIIVMSEPVPDRVAIEFLEHLFRELLARQSLFAAVHTARKKLEHLNGSYPGAVWLPTLCLKPLENYFTWQPRKSDRYLLLEAERIKTPATITRLIRSFLAIFLGGTIFLAGFSTSLLFPQIDLESLTQLVSLANYSPTAELQLPQGTWQYSGSTTWQSINTLVDRQLKTNYPQFKLLRSDHPRLPSGSGTGIRMLINGQVSFALSSRPVNDTEYDAAIIRGKVLKQVPVAIDGVAIVANPNLKLDRLTIKQLSAIYQGKITNWKQLGGQDLSITAYARSPQSGTTEFFRNNVLRDRQYGRDVIFVEESEQAIARVSDPANLGGIYFVSVSEVIHNCNLKLLALARRSGSIAVDLDRDNHYCDSNNTEQALNVEVLRTGEYPLVRRLFIIIEVNSPVDEEVGEAYKNLMLTKEGQKAIADAGFIPIRSF